MTSPLLVIAGSFSGTLLASSSGASNTIILTAALIGGVATVLAAVYLGRKGNERQLNSIEVKVDGRLEAALEQLDRSAGIIATLTGTIPPPALANKNLPGTPTIDPSIGQPGVPTPAATEPPPTTLAP